MTCHKVLNDGVPDQRLLVRNPLVRALLWFCLSIASVVLIFFLLTWVMFLDLPSESPAFDCDDAVLVMYERFSSLGIKSTPIVGDLKVSGEEYGQITHIWLLVDIGGAGIPFDWGQPWFDRQHYEGYLVSRDQLLSFVLSDQLASAQQSPAATP